MKRLCIIGAGHHCRTFHLPALALFRDKYPGRVSVDAIVDPNPDNAAAAASRLGISRIYGDADAMLAAERPDACMAFTSVAANARTALKLMRLGIPLLMEKPLGSTFGEAEEVVRAASKQHARVMVSMNRRFDPQLQQALAWLREQSAEICYVRSTMVRHKRSESSFVAETGLHVVDVVRKIGGDLSAWRIRQIDHAGGRWVQLQLEFASGAAGIIDLLPTAGGNTEAVELYCPDVNVEVRTSVGDHGWRAWAGGELVRDVRADAPEYISNGTFSETEAFICCLEDGSPFPSTPQDVWPAMEICLSAESFTGPAGGAERRPSLPCRTLPHAVEGSGERPSVAGC